jgi:hypothetical protein
MLKCKTHVTVAIVVAVTVFACDASAQSVSVPITERDRGDAQRAIYRYDANGDGSIDRDEGRRGYWSSDPFQFDVNGDGRLTVSELSIRYARRRMDRQGSQSDSASRTPSSVSRYESGSRRDGDRPRSSDSPRSHSKADSAPPKKPTFRTRSPYERLPADLPTWFKEKDADLDGQVWMWEYASAWTDELADQFARHDPNGDGVITWKECLETPTDGTLAGSAPARKETSPLSSSDTTGQAADNGTLLAADVAASPQQARRQLWAKLYSSTRPGTSGTTSQDKASTADSGRSSP